jgi:hypothetical protein
VSICADNEYSVRLTCYNARTQYSKVEFSRAEYEQFRCEVPKRDEVGEERHVIDTGNVELSMQFTAVGETKDIRLVMYVVCSIPTYNCRC